jgi:hypothetical protein
MSATLSRSVAILVQMTAAASPPRPPAEGDDGPSTTAPSPSSPTSGTSADPAGGSDGTGAADPADGADKPEGTDATDGPDGTEGTDGETAPIRVAKEGSTVVIAVEGDLDVTTGEALIDAAEAAVRTGPSRLDIDLRALEDFDEEGAGALVSCHQLGAKLAEGLHYRTGRGPGRDALLTAYSEPADDTTPE